MKNAVLASRSVTPRRLRRTPEQARAEILAAAEAALQDLDPSALTVELLMERTGMTRSSFYHYFKSLDEVTLALFGQVEVEVSRAVDDWLEGAGEADPRETTVDHLTRMFEVWNRHASLMRAMEQAAGRDGAAYERWRERVVNGYIQKTSEFIRRQVEAGRSTVSDPEGIASALILMNVSVAADQVRREEPAAPERLGRTIGHIWNSAIY